MQPWRPEQQDVIARQMAEKAMQGGTEAMAAVVAVTPSVGSATVPALALGGSAQVTVGLTPPLGTDSFIAIPVLYASATLLGPLTLGGVVAKTETSVTVLVRAPLVAVAAGAVLQIVAFRTA